MLLLCDVHHSTPDSLVEGKIVDEPGRSETRRDQPDQAGTLADRRLPKIVHATYRRVVDTKPGCLERRTRRTELPLQGVGNR